MNNINSTNYPDTLYSKLQEFNGDEKFAEIESSNLFDYQKNVFNFMTKTQQRGLLLYHSVGSGKCLGWNTPVLMYDGSIKKVQHVKPGDLLMGDDSYSRQVLNLARGVDDMYNIWYGSAKYTVNKDHILCLKTNKYPIVEEKKDKITVKYLFNGSVRHTDFYFSQNKNYDIVKNECDYFINMLKSNENHKIIHLTVLEYLSLSDSDKKNMRGFRNKIFFNHKQVNTSPLLVGALCAKGYSEVDRKYIINSVLVREYVLAGILGSIGNIVKYKGKDAYSIYFKGNNHSVKRFINDIVFISNTLTIGVKLKKLDGGYHLILYGKELISVHDKSAYSDMNFYPDLEEDTSLYSINIKKTGIGNYYGFCISGNRRFVLGDCTITHNTMTSVSVAEFFKRMNKEIIVLSSKSLQINYKKEIDNFRKINSIKSGDENGEDKSMDSFEGYRFITSNARNMIDKITNTNSKLESKQGIENRLEEALEQVTSKSLDNKVIIVDEAHNLFNSIANGSEMANKFYDMVMNAKNIKVIFMTGTPIINDPFEISICYNMIVGNIKQSNENKRDRNSSITLFPEYYTDFVKYFIAPGGSGILNEGKFKNRIFGLTSYYGDFYSSNSVSSISMDLKQTAKKENYPDRLPVKFEVVEMSNIQSTYYLKARDVEKLETANSYSERRGGIISSGKSEGSQSSTSYRIKSRQACNIVIDENTFNVAEEEKSISKYSTKIDKIVKNIEEDLSASTVGNILIYSTFLEYGVEAVAKFLEIKGFSRYKDNIDNIDENKEVMRYAIFSGKQSEEEKTDILKVFNDDSNKNGELIRILMITKSGTEGLDLKNVRYIHIMEPYWNFSLLQQVIARGVRYKSHISLDEKYRNVQVYMYLSDYNKADLQDVKNKLSASKQKATKIEKTTDIHMLTNAIKNQELIYKFLKAIASTSIECRFFNKEELNYSCFSCKNTNERLFVEDFYTDMKTKNNCIENVKIKTKEIIIDGISYYYAGSNSNISIFKKGDNGIVIKVSGDEYEVVVENILKHLENNNLYSI